MLTHCDICDSDNQIDEYYIDIRTYENLKVSVIVCPVCGYSTPYYFEDKFQRRLTGRIASLYNEIRQFHNRNKAVPESRRRELNKLLKESKSYQSALRDKYVESATAALNNAD